ncbi:MAG TPA: hypothetical protein PKC65_03730 [Pyrinomonadaceae bacterium]|nr:hypothetical protein [Pyrinomonadaceae bacterium]
MNRTLQLENRSVVCWVHYSVMLVFLLGFCAGNALGQVKPPENQDPSSMIEPRYKDDFGQAEIMILNKGFNDTDLEIGKVPYQEIHLQKGLTFAQLNDCSLKLENTVGLISYEFLATDNYRSYKNTHDFFSGLYRNQQPSHLELYIPLYDLSYSKGKRPRMLSKNPKKPGYNNWAVQIQAKSGLPILLTATREHTTKKIYGEILTFVFDDETRARQFDLDFRNTIRACKDFSPNLPPKIKLPPVVIVN